MKAHVRELGRRTAEARRSAKLTQEQLADQATVSVKTIQGVEQGRTEPDLRTLRKIARVLETSIDSLTGADAEGVRADVLIRRIQADLPTLPLRLLEHVAAIVRELASQLRRK
jgi:transcriptional regulator with XRE-family HTH domain